MTSGKFKIVRYTTADRSKLLLLLLELHSTYFSQSTSLQILELRQEKDLKRVYEKYIDFIANKGERTWNILLARSATNVVGCIIGSIETDNDLVLNKIGKLEDWFVAERFRGKGLGTRLYQELEAWFIEKGCKQVYSETWQGNELSIKVHHKLGFFVSAISFGKKL